MFLAKVFLLYKIKLVDLNVYASNKTKVDINSFIIVHKSSVAINKSSEILNL